MKERVDYEDKILTIPNVITMIRLVLSVPLFIFIGTFGITSPLLIASFVIILAASDAVDGFISRKFNMHSRFGEVFDPLADKIFNWGLCVSLIFCGAMPLWPLLILVRDVSIWTVTFYQYQKNRIRMTPTFPAKLKMALQSIGVISTILFGFGTESVLSLIAPLCMIGAISTFGFEIQKIKETYFSLQENLEKISTTSVENIQENTSKTKKSTKTVDKIKQKSKSVANTVENITSPKVKQKSIYHKID